MSLDHLLLWLSAKNAGSWMQFRAAVEDLLVQPEVKASDDPDSSDSPDSDLPLYHQARFALQRLGHVEFHPGNSGLAWQVVPPSVVFLPGTMARGLLCGARSVALVKRLSTIADLEIREFQGMPQRLLLRGPSELGIAASARTLGLHVQHEAPYAILSVTPGVRDAATWVETTIPETPGWTIHRFSPSRLQWIASSQEVAKRAATGLFRFVMKHQWFYYLCWRGCTYQVQVQDGKYAVLSKRQGSLTYDPARGILSVPAICRPPPLVERALVMCSGVLPRFDPSTGRVEYTEVPSDVARLATRLLYQEML